MAASADLLMRIIARKREEVAARRRARPASALRDAVPHAPRDASWSAPRDFAAALRRATPAIIAEIKRRSPSKGPLCETLDPAGVARAYETGGAAALSVLTDREFFGGSDDDLVAARATVSLPVLRKDFTIDAWQIAEAAALGADAVLLIVAVLSDGQLGEFIGAAREYELAALVEVHDERDLERAAAAGAALIGVNNRDLRTFAVDIETAIRLRPMIPPGCLSVAESGIRTAGDVARLRAAGYNALLVGEALIASGDPGGQLRRLLGGDGPQREGRP